MSMTVRVCAPPPPPLDWEAAADAEAAAEAAVAPPERTVRRCATCDPPARNARHAWTLCPSCSGTDACVSCLLYAVEREAA